MHLKVHELRLPMRSSREEEQALLSRVLNEAKKNPKGLIFTWRRMGGRSKRKKKGKRT